MAETDKGHIFFRIEKLNEKNWLEKYESKEFHWELFNASEDDCGVVTLFDRSRDMYMKLTPTAVYLKVGGDVEFWMYRKGKWIE